MINDLVIRVLEKDIFILLSEVIIVISVIVLFTSILIDFVMFNGKSNTVKEKKSIVETGTMTAFLILFSFVLKYSMKFTIDINLEYRRTFALLGGVIVFIGSILNVYGRFTLGGNWANNIKIYSNHKLVNHGLYKIVRHPLYSSIMLMFMGASLAYLNIYAFILEMNVFVPFMYYRAKEEEKLLTEIFPEYLYYKKTTGMFIPKIIKRG